MVNKYDECECFQKGDRVVSVRNRPSSSGVIIAGDAGTICEVLDYGIYGVFWDRDIEGHSCDGKCPVGYGWRVRENEIRLEKPLEYPDTAEVDAFLLDVGCKAI